MKKKRIVLDPELAYEIVIAALDVVGSVSLGVHKRVDQAYDRNEATSYPGVSPKHLVELRRALNKIGSGGIADKVIAEEDAARRERLLRHREGYQS